MVIKRGYFLITVLLCGALLSGCWDSDELDELGIVVAAGIDKTEDDEYLLVTQVINPSEIATEAPTTRPPASTYSTTGKTLLEAFRKMTHKSPRKMYLSQLRLVVIGKDLAEEGIMQPLDLFYRDHEFRTGFYVTISKETDVETLLSILTPYEKIPANKLMHSIEAVEENHGSSHGITIDELITQIRNKGQNPVITGLLMEGPAESGTNISNVENIDAPTKITIDHLGVLKGDQLVGWMNEDESLGYNYTQGDINSSVVTHPCSEGTAGIEILRGDNNMGVTFENDEPSISIELNLEGNIAEIDCPVDLSQADVIQQLNQQTEEEITRLIEESIAINQNEFETDIFGFGDLIHRKNPKYWKTVENNWDEQFKELVVEIQVKVELRRKGSATQPITKES
ncbi:Ger(x)C family spore germination protein [Halalkalibacillus halophilus]|uniref:Ger(x)C family spore germination protein n=1 Tax=Halalkalibacillus halophilus TaxID=392827 RepID=UPI00146DCEA0|nr:Ger(x)C family spore germination protein [Halalkalibacillus halophilus]